MARERSSSARVRGRIRRERVLISIRSRVSAGNRAKIGAKGGSARGNGDDPALAVDDGGASSAEERPLDAAEGDAGRGTAGFALSRGDSRAKGWELSSATRPATAAATDAPTATGHRSRSGLGFKFCGVGMGLGLGGWLGDGEFVYPRDRLGLPEEEVSWAARIRGASSPTYGYVVLRDNAAVFWVTGCPRGCDGPTLMNAWVGHWMGGDFHG